MSNRDASFYIVDIFIAIYKIKLYTKKFNNANDLLNSMLEWDATIRQLEIIGEATNWLIKLELLENKKYRKIVDFRNIVAHAYFGIDEDEVWFVVKHKLNEFKEELKSLVKQKNINLKKAISYAKEENTSQKELIIFLDKLLLL